MSGKTNKKRDKYTGIQVLISTVLTIALFAIVAILMSCGIALVFKVDMYFWAATVGSTIAVILTFITWMPTGEQMALNLPKVKNGILRYEGRAAYIIKHQKFKELREFCDKKTESNKKDIIIEILSTLQIEYRIYELAIKKNKTAEEQAEFDKSWASLDDDEKKLVTKLSKHGVKHEVLLPGHITVGKATKHSIVNKNDEGIYKFIRILTKSIWGIFTTCFVTFVVVTPNKNFGIPQIVMITMWFFTFGMSIYGAIKTGYNGVLKHRHLYNIKQADLCAEFFDYCDIKVTDVDSQINFVKEPEEKKELLTNESQ